jgi:hypothetical protein
MGYMLERQWEAHTRIQDGFSRIVFEDGEEITVKNDGKTGIDFVEEYLDEMKKNYPSHLVAADQLLQIRLGRSYKTIRNLRSRYLSELALVSLNCCFGREEIFPTMKVRKTSIPRTRTALCDITVRSTDSTPPSRIKRRCAAIRCTSAG